MSQGGFQALFKMHLVSARTRRRANGLTLPNLNLSGAQGLTAGTGPWAPPVVAGAQLQWCADVGVYSDTGLTTPQTTNGGAVQGWQEQAGSHHATASAGGTLAVGGAGTRNGVEFLNTCLVTPTITAPTSDFSYLVVWRPIADTNGFSGLLTRGNGANGSLYFGNGNQLRIWIGATFSGSTNLSASAPLLVSTAVRSGTALRFWRNGTADALNPITCSGALAATEAYGLAADTNASEGGHKVLAAVLAYSNAISNPDRQALHAYLGSYYGITMGGD